MAKNQRKKRDTSVNESLWLPARNADGQFNHEQPLRHWRQLLVYLTRMPEMLAICVWI